MCLNMQKLFEGCHFKIGWLFYAKRKFVEFNAYWWCKVINVFIVSWEVVILHLRSFQTALSLYRWQWNLVGIIYVKCRCVAQFFWTSYSQCALGHVCTMYVAGMLTFSNSCCLSYGNNLHNVHIFKFIVEWEAKIPSLFDVCLSSNEF